MKRPRRNSKSGFALLLVFLMAAILAIALYEEIPRVGFQTQRNKEQLLMERGEQYKIAIRRFQRTNGRYPANLDELEKLNNKRFLRQRYKDPLTGKDEWRLIHTANGMLTDSKNQQQGQGKDKPVNMSDGFLAEMPGLGSTPAGTGGANAAARRRASEGGTTDPTGQIPGSGAPLPGANGQLGPNGQPVTSANGNVPGAPGMPPGIPGVPGLPGTNPGATPGMPGAPVNSQTGGASAQPAGNSFVGSGTPFLGGGSPVGAQPNNPAGTNPVYAGQNPAYPTAAGSNGAAPGFPNPGATTGQANQAAGMINSILTSPRPGGLAGIQSQAGVSGGGVGIAGVASTLDADSIMEYADHTNYSEWEFIYDGRWQPPADPRQGNGGTAVSQMGNMSGSSPPGSAIGTPIGAQGAQPGQSPMGGQPPVGGQGAPGSSPTGMGAMGQMNGMGNTQNTNLNLRPGRQ